MTSVPVLSESIRAALQQTLAGEHAALAVCAVLGARTSASANPTLRSELDTLWATHRTRRDLLDGWLRADGANPVAAAPNYALPGPIASADEIRNTAALVEERCTALYSDLVSHTVDEIRTWAIGVLRDSALEELTLGAAPRSFPGAEEFLSS